MNSTDSQVIVKRFFAALDILIAEKKLRGIKTFTDRYGIDNRNLYTLRKRPSYGIFQAAWLTYLARDYSISSKWLLLGIGQVFSQNVQNTCSAKKDVDK